MPRVDRRRKRKAGPSALNQKVASEFVFDSKIDAIAMMVGFMGNRVVKVLLDATYMSKEVLAMFDKVGTAEKTFVEHIQVRGVTYTLHGDKQTRKSRKHKPSFNDSQWCIVRDGSLHMVLTAADAKKYVPDSILVKEAEMIEGAYEFERGEDDDEAEGSEEGSEDERRRRDAGDELDIDAI